MAAHSACLCLEARAVSFAHGAQPILQQVDLALEAGRVTAILGPSGCGKSTLLRILAGLQKADHGNILFDGQNLTAPRREIAYLAQGYQALPWLNVARNIAFSGRMRRGIAPLPENLLQETGLMEAAHLYPSQLSGGMIQRLNLARVFYQNPKVLLLDEPFAALDALLREAMHNLLLSMLDLHRPAVSMVTHDLDEALFLADTILILSDRPAQVRVRVENPFKGQGLENADSAAYAAFRRFLKQALSGKEQALLPDLSGAVVSLSAIV